MIAAILKLNHSDCKALKISDAYSIHRIIYDLFPDKRTVAEKKSNIHSGILYADKGGGWNERTILMLADRNPVQPAHGTLEVKPVPPSFLEHNIYRFEVTMNPTKRCKETGKTVAIRGHEQLLAWFSAKSAGSWGFETDIKSLSIRQMGASTFTKGETNVTHNRATFTGTLRVVDQDKFQTAFKEGIGRARGFGFGLLQIAPFEERSK